MYVCIYVESPRIRKCEIRYTLLLLVGAYTHILYVFVLGLEWAL